MLSASAYKVISVSSTSTFSFLSTAKYSAAVSAISGIRSLSDRWLLSGVHETNDLSNAPADRMRFEEQIVVIGKAHSSENDFVHVRSKSDIRHNFVIRLIRISEERNLLSRHDSVVQVDARNSGRGSAPKAAFSCKD